MTIEQHIAYFSILLISIIKSEGFKLHLKTLNHYSAFIRDIFIHLFNFPNHLIFTINLPRKKENYPFRNIVETFWSDYYNIYKNIYFFLQLVHVEQKTVLLYEPCF